MDTIIPLQSRDFLNDHDEENVAETIHEPIVIEHNVVQTGCQTESADRQLSVEERALIKHHLYREQGKQEFLSVVDLPYPTAFLPDMPTQKRPIPIQVDFETPKPKQEVVEYSPEKERQNRIDNMKKELEEMNSRLESIERSSDSIQFSLDASHTVRQH